MTAEEIAKSVRSWATRQATTHPAVTWPGKGCSESIFRRLDSTMEYERHYRRYPPHQFSAPARDSIPPASLGLLRKPSLRVMRVNNRTEFDDARIAEFETLLSLKGKFLTAMEPPTIPAAAIRAWIVTGARFLKQFPSVREGLIVADVQPMDYDKDRYG